MTKRSFRHIISHFYFFSTQKYGHASQIMVFSAMQKIIAQKNLPKGRFFDIAVLG
jgi:hypothetical protein